ncbi:proline--tRNA ligase [Candidatus Woesearchaeota archaeon]|nr:MAG: proline--tRNA ligase [Candidatus Woesearchaeota archaeon]
MKETNLGITVRKEDNSSEWYTQVIQKARLVEYGPVSGCLVYRPESFQIWEKIRDFFDKEIKKRGVKNAYFPLLIPESLFKKEAEHVKGFAPEVAWVTHGGSTKLNEKLAIRPTSETIMYDSYRKWVRSYKDLPILINQWCNIVRWEFKHPVPFLRGREFLWQEGHNVFATQQEVEKDTKEILDLYAKTFEELLAVPVIKGRKSEKEKFAGALYTLSIETFLSNGKAVQGATSHNLGQNFAKAFNISFIDENEKKQYAWQNSWGLSTRSLGIMILTHSDNKGLVLPPKVAQHKVVIIPIFFKDKKEAVLKAANDLKSRLKSFDPILDDRDDYSTGWKFNDWELKGIPLRIEIGPKDLEKKQAVLVTRHDGRKESVKIKDAPKKVAELLEQMQKELFEKAKKFIKDNTVTAKNFDELKKAINNKKLVEAYWCENQECENWIKDKTGGAKTLNIPFEQPSMKGKKCVWCKKQASVLVYFAKSY